MHIVWNVIDYLIHLQTLAFLIAAFVLLLNFNEILVKTVLHHDEEPAKEKDNRRPF